VTGAADLDFAHCYRAIQSRDARFDGLFITGVRTTRVYCRPSCPAPVCPKPENVAFFRTAAAAQRAGLRACKRCRPDASPGSPEWDVRGDLVARAMRLIADGVVDREGVPGLARRLAVSDRQLRRLLEAGVGAPPLALARSQRAQTARVLIEGTDLPFARVALAAGFASVRQFNDTVRHVFAATPSQLRCARRAGAASTAPGEVVLRLAARNPYDGDGVLRLLAARAIPGVEELADGVYRRTLALPGGPGVVALEPRRDHVRATLRLTSLTDLAAAVSRCRRLLDLDADPSAYGEVLATDAALRPLVAARPGLRAPGTVDPAESTVRAVLGQQVSLAAARTLAARLVAVCGAPLAAPDGALTHAFPASAAIAAADLGAIGLPRARQHTLRELAHALAGGELELGAGADRAEVRERLLAIPGVGPWTAEYVALRALGDPDAFPAGDVGLQRGARALGLPADHAGLTARAERWRPWRRYAAQHLWAAAA
jgi:AraC family transcriptional regulator, regulatory protein of adaptative response / DNA-3-methyladenine glycosylase II